MSIQPESIPTIAQRNDPTEVQICEPLSLFGFLEAAQVSDYLQPHSKLEKPAPSVYTTRPWKMPFAHAHTQLLF